jgi:hypothetical protein
MCYSSQRTIAGAFLGRLHILQLEVMRFTTCLGGSFRRRAHDCELPGEPMPSIAEEPALVPDCHLLRW